MNPADQVLRWTANQARAHNREHRGIVNNLRELQAYTLVQIAEELILGTLSSFQLHHQKISIILPGCGWLAGGMTTLTVSTRPPSVIPRIAAAF